MKRKPVIGKCDAIRAVLGRRGRGMKMDDLLPRVEAKLKMVVGRSKLYTLLSVMMVGGGIGAEGRGRDRVYSLRRGRSAKGGA